VLRVGIIGANGQVGSEVSLLLKGSETCLPIPICRTKLGSAFLRYGGLDCRHGDVTRSAEEATDLLSGLDLIVDFSLPRGHSSSLKADIHRLVNSVLMNSGSATYIYASSIMAYGMSERHIHFKNYKIAHSIYGKSKRYAEAEVKTLSKRLGRKFYILRLGEVNGEIQSCTRLRSNNLRIAGPAKIQIPTGRTYAVLTTTIMNTIETLASQRIASGAYTLSDAHRLEWRDLASYYAERAGLSQIEYQDKPQLAGRKLRSVLMNGAAHIAERYRNEISSYLLCYMPKVEEYLRLERLKRTASKAVLLNAHQEYDVFGVTYTGNIELTPPAFDAASLASGFERLRLLRKFLLDLESGLSAAARFH